MPGNVRWSRARQGYASSAHEGYKSIKHNPDMFSGFGDGLVRFTTFEVQFHLRKLR